MDLRAIAKLTNGFSGADLSYIVQRAAKFAIKDSIEAQKAFEESQVKKEGEETDVVMEDQPDPVPYITKSHFEEAMKTAKRSVSPAELRRYEAYAQQLQSSRGQLSSFKFDNSSSGPSQPAGGETSTATDGGASFGNVEEEEDDLYN